MNLFRGANRRKLKLALQGYRQLEKDRRVSAIRDLKSALAMCPISLHDNSGALLGVPCGNVETVIRQYLLQRLVGRSFDYAILLSVSTGKSLAFPLPEPWRKTLEDSGFSVNRPACLFLWVIFVATEFVRGLARALRLARPRPREDIAELRKQGETVAYFIDLAPNNVVPSTPANPRFSLPQWFAQSFPPTMQCNVFAHTANVPAFAVGSDLKVRSVSQPFGSLPKSLAAFFAYTGAATKVSLAGLAGLLVGKWWPSLMAGEALVASTVRINAPEQNADSYFFQFSSAIYRPLWTYEAERRGSKILCYFYTTYEQPSVNGRLVTQDFEFAACTWPHYIFWSEHQKQTLSSAMRQSFDFSIAKPCWLVDSPAELPPLPGPSVAVFPIEAHRRTMHLGFSTLADYFNQVPNLSALFLDDVVSTLHKSGLHPAVKGKRDVGSRLNTRYRRLRSSMVDSAHISLIDSDVSPVRLASRCLAVISMPFTATALLASKSTPSIYYDPIGWIAKDDPAAHGIPILSGREELQTWLRELAGPVAA